MTVEKNIKDGFLNAPASEAGINEVISSARCHLPADYVQFLLRHDGGEGFIGENYIIFWKAEELIKFNHEYEVERYAPGILLFGSNGGGEGYGFDLLNGGMPVVRVPFIGMDRRHVKLIANSFTEMFNKLMV